MTRFAKKFALVVLIAMWTSSLGAQSLSLNAHPRPASGCHEHGSKAPAPRPADNQCCLIGHDTAAPQSSPSQPVLSELRADLLMLSTVRLPGDSSSNQLAMNSGDPPGITPLRI